MDDNSLNIKNIASNYFSILLDKFNGGVLIEDNNRLLQFANRNFVTLFNIDLSPDKLIGLDCRELLQQAKSYFCDPEIFAKNIEDIVNNKIPVHNERIESIDGKIIERTFIPVFNLEICIGYIWIFRDITGFISVEKSLKHRLKFEELITTLSYSFISAKVDDLDKSINEALGDVGRFIKTDRSYVFELADKYEQMSNTYEWCAKGITPEIENLQNLPIESFPWMMRKLRNFESVVIPMVENLADEASGEKQILEMQGIKSLIIVPLVFSNRLIGFLGFDYVRDYREWDEDSVKLLRVFGNVLSGALKRREEEIKVKTALAREKELNELKSRFVTLVSHEFRTPLAAILSSTEILEYYSSNLSEEKKEIHYKKIKSSINNLLDILNEIAEINLIDSGKLKIEPKIFFFKQFLVELIDEMNVYDKCKPKFSLTDFQEFEIYSDKKLLRQIVSNLISNSIKYTPEEKSITVWLEKKEKSFIFNIMDTGVGIPWKDQPTIFNPFVRSENVHHIKGSGLGLNIAKKAADLLSGKLTFHSKEGEGTTFSLHLPIKQPV